MRAEIDEAHVADRMPFELGQMLVLAVMLPALALVRRYVLPGKAGMIILSALVAHTAWHWMTERADVLWRYDWPRIDRDNLVTFAVWIVALVAAGAAIRYYGRRWRIGGNARGAATLASGD